MDRRYWTLGRMVAVPAIVVAIGCTNNEGGTGDGGRFQSFTLTAQDAKSHAVLSGVTAANGSLYYDVAVTLANTSEVKPLPTSILNYSLRTAAALVYMATPLSQSLSPACPTNVTVAQGGMVTCRVAFELPKTETPSKVLYSDLAGRTASADAPAIPALMTTCLDWTNGMSPPCLACLTKARDPGGACEPLDAAANVACRAELDSLCIQSTQLGCPQPKSGCTWSAGCTSAIEAYRDCQNTQCQNVCL